MLASRHMLCITLLFDKAFSTFHATFINILNVDKNNIHVYEKLQAFITFMQQLVYYEVAVGAVEVQLELKVTHRRA